MFELNPLNNPDAGWQHITMVVVSLILGCFIGFINGSDQIRKLKTRLAELNRELATCRTQQANVRKMQK